MNRKHLRHSRRRPPVRAGLLVGCATAPSDAEVSAKAAAMLKSSFNARGQAKLDRLDQDDTQKTCSAVRGQGAAEGRRRAHREGQPRDDQVAGRRQVPGRLEERREDRAGGPRACSTPTIRKGPVGANCYACHQLAPQELSFGTIGPSLYQFGKSRGYSDEIRKYAYGKIWNAEAYTACSNMPRFGHNGILTEQQIKDVVALLMDPNSPVNK